MKIEYKEVSEAIVGDKVFKGKLAREIEETRELMRVTGGEFVKKFDDIWNRRNPISPARAERLGIPEILTGG